MYLKDMISSHIICNFRFNSSHCLSGSLVHGTGETVGSTGIGGGWQLAWQWTEKEGSDGRKEGGFKRIYLHQEGAQGSLQGSIISLPGGGEDREFIQAAALVSQPALFSEELMKQHPVGPAMVHPSETAMKGPSWRDLLEPGVKHALVVGIGIQILQQVQSKSLHGTLTICHYRYEEQR